jgi:hypothetical protein
MAITTDRGALLSLDLSDNHLVRASDLRQEPPCFEGVVAWGDLDQHYEGGSKHDFRAFSVLSDAMQDMGTLTSLNLSANELRAEGGKIVAEAIKVTNCAIAVVLTPVLCPSDHWLNCCCLLLSNRITGHYRC